MTFLGQTKSQVVDTGMMPIPGGIAIGSNSISFDIMGQQETLAYNAATVIARSRHTLISQQHATIPFPHARTDDALRARSQATFQSLKME